MPTLNVPISLSQAISPRKDHPNLVIVADPRAPNPWEFHARCEVELSRSDAAKVNTLVFEEDTPDAYKTALAIVMENASLAQKFRAILQKGFVFPPGDVRNFRGKVWPNIVLLWDTSSNQSEVRVQCEVVLVKPLADVLTPLILKGDKTSLDSAGLILRTAAAGVGARPHFIEILDDCITAQPGYY